MAQGRLYRDYYSDAESFETPVRRTISSARLQQPPTSPVELPAVPRIVNSLARPSTRDGSGRPRAGVSSVAQPRHDDRPPLRIAISDLRPQHAIGVPRSSEDEHAPPRPVISDLGLNLDGAAYSSIPENAGILSETPSEAEDEVTAYGLSATASPPHQEPTLHQDQMDDSRLYTYYREAPMSPHIQQERPSDLQSLDLTAAPGPVIPWERRGGTATPTTASVDSASVFSQAAQSSSRSSGSRMPEFFSRAVFQTILHNPTISHQLLKFAHSRLCGENMEFLGRVEGYQSLLTQVSKTIYEIHREFVASSAPTQINIPQQCLIKVNTEMRSALSNTLPMLENIFSDAQNNIEELVYGDVYPKFVRHQMSVSAGKALGTNRGKFAGLGDCFVLTDPAKADNPIVYASDGFVKVTGYSRNEIIPRNCRFLQSRHTDRAAVRRLRTSVDKREESVELLLNNRKDGQPFWNLLYTTPLFDGNGNLVFFLGGQINCSTSVHSASDVLRILAQSSDEPKDETLATQLSSPPPAKPRSRSFFSALRSSRDRTGSQQTPPRIPGMEHTLVDRLEEMPLKNQMRTFYTAYSNYIVVNYSTFFISFISVGIIDLLFPIKAAGAASRQSPVGQDVFKFLANHTPNGGSSMGRDFKQSVKAPLSRGQAVSVDLKLCARPYMGFERFATHWTPLKDEGHEVAWVVLTLGNEHRVGHAM
ncbi:Uu.00g003170.m01.CDS01 [Anthostomella pinea]|uniref:Uu.00g003170.m01.CDS01 n=1 Tax=Anthostomella pinea TaxID=933095 RepID=A0AAI8VKB6_9PEZI|nr:Uu.00g003170.m01.CDS01 [Anthostomella pinea]